MEWLTERNKNSLAMAACCGKACEYNYVCEVGGFGECRGMDDIIDRLVDIEDILGDSYDLDRLRELVEADRAGRCVVLPCKVGTPVYRIVWHIGCAQMDDESYRMVSPITAPFTLDMVEEFGRTIFLTRKAAEAALKGEQDG